MTFGITINMKAEEIKIGDEISFRYKSEDDFGVYQGVVLRIAGGLLDFKEFSRPKDYKTNSEYPAHLDRKSVV